MNRLERAIRDLHELDALAERQTYLGRLHPAGVTLAVLLFMVTTVSFGKYDLMGVLGMAPGLLLLFALSGLSFGRTMKRMSGVLVFLAVFGLFNPILDREVISTVAGIPLTSGMVSMAVLLLKGFFCLGASGCLAASIGMEGICRGLQALHIPRLLIIVILLIYRYLILLLQEGNRIFTAYELRAPGQKGIHYTAWGSLLGQLLLASMSQAEQVYDSMELRGFDGHFVFNGTNGETEKTVWIRTTGFVLVTMAYLLLFRTVPIFFLLFG